MAKVEFSAAWWKKNGAKTMPDSGMDEALKTWESAKKGGADKLVSALTALHKAAVTAERTANKTLHKESIGYLQAYQRMCAEFISRLGNADGSSLGKTDKLLTKEILAEIGKSPKGKMYVDELMYLYETKTSPKAASDTIFKTYISESGKRQVNLPNDVRIKCEELAKAKTWSDDGWKKARDTIVKLSLTGTNFEGLKKTVLLPLELEPLLDEIRAA